MMQSENQQFMDRVAALREQWSETRQAAIFGARPDRASQFRVLTMTYLWCAEASDQVRAVYGDELPVDQTAMPPESEPSPAFSVFIGSGYSIFVSLEVVKENPHRWHVVVSLTSPGPGPSVTAGRARKNPHWTRLNIQELFLGILASIERAKMAELPVTRSAAFSPPSTQRLAHQLTE